MATEHPTSREPRLRLAAGRTALWRGSDSLQLGVDPRHALVIDGLTPGLVEVIRRLDGRHAAAELLTVAAAAGTDHSAAAGLLDRLTEARLIEAVDRAERVPPALVPDAATWRLRTGRDVDELVDRRAGATVEVHGNGRVAVGVATVLAAAGVGCVVVHAAGRVGGWDVGTGYLPSDVGRPRRTAAAAAVRRARPVTHAEQAPDLADVVVLADAAVWDPNLALRLITGRVPHLAVHAREASVVVGPLVLPGRTSCLRCADLHRADADPCWPQVAAQLATDPPAAELAGAHAAAALAAEHVLTLLTGRGEVPDEPPAAGTTFELDPLHGRLLRRRWPPHPRCGCGAAGTAAAPGDRGHRR
jgi:bacteriocin biosynthesis cyclodehydratase domain-containing protein